MNILISVENFYPAIGGAEISLAALAQKLAEKHKVYVVQPGEKDETICLNEIHVVKKMIPSFFSRWLVRSYQILKSSYWAKNLEVEINKIRPDLIITQLNFAPVSIDMAVKHGVPSILFIRSYEHFCPIGFINGTDCNKKCNSCIPLKSKHHFLCLTRWLKWNSNAIRNADLVIANSYFVSSLTKMWYGVEPSVVYPTIKNERYQSDFESKQYISIIKPTQAKGAGIFLKIAETLPDKKFIAVGGDGTVMNKKIISSHRNVEFIEWTSNMGEIYAKTKILLAPAEWPEPFGRVIIEAGINGIPSIASKRGGLPEAVGKGGTLVDNIYDIGEWVKAIKCLDDNGTYDCLSKNAILHAQEFEFEANYSRFIHVVKEKLGLTI
ncbi:glycosyltransferase family 4 protein [Methanolobus chelungpuianus]|uniref:Glycosyltransferase n=1 Tax=Methanolobus chelungpuianus TaxID=502115 RepID=A0AAE3HA52_9EURY|nr:glycosyltransferase family 4 protein [Methanolobus chelungpuianus]MCQ6962760.1 hypothetical protein [Methanolobus chelungpuianus]